MTGFLTASRLRDSNKLVGVALAIASVVLPALPLGPMAAQPPMPLAALWAAYGWASHESPGWGAPVGLAALGLLHDQLAGGPLGVFAFLYLSAFLIGRVVSHLASAPNLVALWGGFAVTGILMIALAALIARLAFGANAGVRAFAEAVAITILFYPLVRRFYMSDDGPGGR